MSARGEVRYRLTADTADFQRGMKGAEKQLESTAQKVGRFSDAMGKTATTLARSSQAFGLPAGALRTLDDVMDVAELGANNLSKSMVGLNAATLGVVGAGLALGAVLGGWLRQIPAVAKAADDAAMAMRRLFTSQANLDRQALGQMPQDQFQKRIGAIDAGVQSGLLSHLKGSGASNKTLRKYGFGVSVEKETEARAAHDRAQSELSSLLNHQERVTSRVEMSITAMFDAQAESFRAATELTGTVPDTLLVAHKQRDLGIGARMAAGATFGLGPTKGPGMFSGLSQSLPEILMGALMGGGSGLKSAGGLFGGLLGKGIGSKVGGLLGSFIPGLGTLLGGVGGGLLGKAFGGIKSLFGFGGPSKEEKAAEAAKKEAEKQRIQAAARTMKAEGVTGLMGSGDFFRADAEHHGTIFAAAWSQVVKEKGVAAAVEAFGGAFDRMKADIEGRGGEMPAWMKAVSSDMALGKSDAFKAASGMGSMAAGVLGSFGKSGGLTPEVFKAFEQEARSTFAAGSGAAAGLGMGAEEATKAGFSAANPLLKELVNQSVVSGQTLSADIQAMVEAQGIVPDVEFQQLDELRAIRAAIGGLAPAYPGSGEGGGALGGYAEKDTSPPQFHSGGDVKQGGLAMLQTGERVLSAAEVRGGGGGSVSVTVNVADTNASPERIAAAITAALKRNNTGMPLALERAGFVRRK